MHISSSAPVRTAEKPALTRYPSRRDTETSTEPSARDPINTEAGLRKGYLRL